MKKAFKILSIALSCLLLLSCIAGCGKSAESNSTTISSNAAETTQAEATQAETTKALEPVEIKFAYWANAAEQKNFEFMSAGIENTYPDVKVKLQQYPTSDEFWTAIPAAIAAKTAPDVIAFSDEGNFEYIVNGTVAPLDELIDTVKFDKGRIAASLYKGWSYENKLYGIPYDASTSMMTINKDMWDKAGLTDYPKTMEEVVTASKALTKDGIYGICANITEFHITQYIHAFGGSWESGKTINSSENEAGIQFLVDLFTKHKVAVSPKQVGAAWDGEVFAKEKAAVSIGGPWYVGYVKEAGPTIKMVSLPIPKGTVESQSAYSHGFSITSQSNSKEAAMKFIAYATRDEAQVNAIQAVGYAPAVESLMPQFTETNKELQPIFENMTNVGVPFAYPKETKNFSAELVKGVEEIVFKPGEKTVKALLDELQSKFGTN